MSLRDWHNHGWLRPHRTNRRQIVDLFATVDRDLEDAQSARLSPDWQFGIAYNAALKLCTILLFAEGFRPDRALAHFRTLQSLPHVLGNDRQGDADYLDSCRSKRNTAEYDAAGRISQEDATELISFAVQLKEDVLRWLEDRHPGLASNS